jgi:sporulation protein YlmC with PRC-barrel domain
MFRKLMATTALATLVATGAFAQDATTPTPDPAVPADTMKQDAPAMKAEGHLASNIIGESVYNSTAEDAQHIGDVNDIVVGADGNIEFVVVGVGGFLGIGEKEVAIDFAELDWAERDGDRWLVAPTTKEQLEQQAAFDRSAYEPDVPVAATDPAAPGLAPATDTTAQAPAEPTPDTTAEAPADPASDTTAEAPADPAPADQMAQTPADPAAPAAGGSTDTTTTAAIDKSTLKEMPATEVRAEEMVGTTVYGSDDANVGEIGDVLLSGDGKVDAYIVDVGGFLGVGEKEVAIGSDNLSFMVDDDGNKYLYTSFSKEQLDAAPAYDESTYAEKRDEQRLMVQ